MRTAFIIIVSIAVASLTGADDKPSPELEKLINNLKSSQDSERIAAIQALEKLGRDARPASSALCDTGCRDFKDEIRKRAGLALTSVRPDLAPQVVVLRDETDSAKLIEAANAIGNLGPKDGVAALPALRLRNYKLDKGPFKRVPDKDAAVVVACIRAIGAVLPDDKYAAGEVAQAGVMSPNLEIRVAGARAAGEIGAARPKLRKEIIEHLRIMIGTDRSTEARVAALHAMGKQGADARSLLKGLQLMAMNDKNEEIRKAADEAAKAIEKEIK